MSLYELTFILRQDVANSEIKKLTDIIKKGGGEVLKTEYWGLRHLAYLIKKNKKGHYTMLVFKLPDVKVLEELKRTISLSEEIISNLVIKIKSFDNKDSIMMQQEKTEKRHEIKKV